MSFCGHKPRLRLASSKFVDKSHPSIKTVPEVGQVKPLFKIKQYLIDFNNFIIEKKDYIQ